jgi:hypothetical protein
MDRFHTPQLANAHRITANNHQREIRKVFKDMTNLLMRKGGDYNNLGSMVEQFPFGDKSWATLLWIKSRRLCSVLMSTTPNFESVDDTIIDLANYAVAYLAWRRLVTEQPDDAHSSNSAE